MMKLIEVGELIQTLDDYGPLTDEILAAIEESPIIEPDKARLLTKKDIENSREKDEMGFIPCCAEYRDGHVNWSITDRIFDTPKFRLWSRLPTKEQMADTPWEDGA